MKKSMIRIMRGILPVVLLALMSAGCEKEKLTVTDVDGNVYNTVAIGNQVWMASDLKTTKFRDGSVIPVVTGNSAWGALTTPGACDYDNDPAKGAVYGKIYNFYAVADARGLCPVGWHVPTSEEHYEMLTTLGLDVAGNMLREVGTAHWTSPHAGTTNESGFTALGGGYRSSNGEFKDINWLVAYWSSTANSSTSAYELFMYSFNSYAATAGLYKNYGLYVRCMQDK
jgi:uncharacterized protein (TIGR02145 family)